MDDMREEISSEEEYADDRVIGRAFRWSLMAFAIITVAVGAGIAFVKFGEKPDEVVEEAIVEAPKVREQPAEVQAPSVRFTDITEQAGIDFVHVNGAYGDKLLPETMGGGVAFLDYDNDGDQDLLLVNSTYWPGHEPADQPAPTTVLYRNDGTGKFDNVTADSGLGIDVYGQGVAVGDYDNDGWADVFITTVGDNRLFHNDQGVFREVTAEAGVQGATGDWGTSAAFLDYDNDGDLDLFVANYVRWSPDIDFEIDFKLTGIGRAYGPPTTFAGSHPYLYRNDGDKGFTNVSAEAGVQVDNPATGQPMGKALGLGIMDVDGDGWLDILVANDTVQNFLFHNRGDGSFEDMGVMYGVAFDRNGAATGAMGVDGAHFRNDGDLGFAVGNFANEMTSLYVTQAETTPLADESIVEGIGPPSRAALTFGLFFFDYDLDGRLDLFQANGHLETEINVVQASQHYAQPAQLFWNCGPDCASSFLAAPAQDSGDLGTPLVGRGAAYADIDGDGDLDILVTQNGRRPMLLRNDQALGHHWLRVQLVGAEVNLDAIGAWIELTAGGVTQRRQVMPTRSYISQVELPVTFGLGKADKVDGLRVRWPDGSTQEIKDVTVDSLLVIEQPESTDDSRQDARPQSGLG